MKLDQVAVDRMFANRYYWVCLLLVVFISVMIPMERSVLDGAVITMVLMFVFDIIWYYSEKWILDKERKIKMEQSKQIVPREVYNDYINGIDNILIETNRILEDGLKIKNKLIRMKEEDHTFQEVIDLVKVIETKKKGKT